MLMFRNVIAWNSSKAFSITDPNAIVGFLSVVEVLNLFEVISARSIEFKTSNSTIALLAHIQLQTTY